jgi:hypothetical protein
LFNWEIFLNFAGSFNELLSINVAPKEIPEDILTAGLHVLRHQP